MNKPSKRIVIILFFLVGIIGFGNQTQAAVLAQITATPASVATGATTSYTIAFNTTTTIPNTGKITIQFPAGFDVSGASFTSWTGFDGTRTLTVDSQTITITRTSGTSSTAGDKTIVLGNIVNTSATANNYQAIITTKNAADTPLDGPTSTVYFQIFASHSETNIDGIYYLRDDSQTHYQNNGNTFGWGTDIGTFSRTVPTSNEDRSCGGWVGFYFDENGTYAQTNQINNIYYHAWWLTSDNQGELGYDKTGFYGLTPHETFTVNLTNSPNKTGDHYLYAGKQTLGSPLSILGNAIYNFELKLTNVGQNPSIISLPNQSSFIIINLPSDVILQSLDSDSDGLTDYAELFTYFTNPYNADTDNDGWNDKYEVDNSLNPVDPDSAPTFGKWLIKQYNSEIEGGNFGSSISSISDIDGDGKEDVLVGAPLVPFGDFLNVGSAYIYSSSTGNLIKQYYGGADYDGFGYSISSISDIDGDGKEDVLVGAPYIDSEPAPNDAGSAYIYSSSTGNLIKQYNGDADFDSFGSPVSSISDIDGDGKDDVLVGVPYADPGGLTNAGSVYIYSSSTGNLIKQYNGGAVEDLFGYSISSISDIDGDGKDDVLVGAPYADPGGLAYAGSAYIYSSNTGNLLKQYNGGVDSDQFGSSISSISDIDGDGKDEVLIGASGADSNGLSNPGSVYIYSSNTGNLIKQYNGTEHNQSFGGISISSISDIDGDGKEDVLVGSPYTSPSGFAEAGSVYIYSSNTGNLIKQYNGRIFYGSFGYSVSSILDIDGDGKEDVLVGAPLVPFGDFFSVGSAYIYSSTGYVPIQSWSKGNSKVDSFDLDDYFTDPNNSTIPARNQTVTYTASTADNPYIDVSINESNNVSFFQPAEWTGSETVIFTATDSTNLSSTSNAVTLTVSGTKSLNTPTIGTPTVNSPTSITWTWTDNSEIEGSYRVDYVNTGGGTANDMDDLYPQTAKSSSGSTLSWTDNDLSPNTQYSVHIHAYRTDTGESESSAISSSVYTLVSTPTISDTDGNGMSDSWEINNFGNLNQDPNDDPDADGWTNLQEYQLGFDPNNASPSKPIGISPVGAGITLTPILEGGDYSDTETDPHIFTEWQVASDTEFLELTFADTTPVDKQTIQIPIAILKPETTYYWRLRYSDLSGWSAWSDTVEFTTESSADFLAENTNIDTTDTIASDTGTIQSYLQSPDTFPDLPSGYLFYGGIFSFRIEGITPGATVSVTFQLYEPFQQDYKWFKYYPYLEQWDDTYATHIISGIGTNQVTIEFKDGGFGDIDGLENGIIVDPSGPGIFVEEPTDDNDNKQSSCFIATACYGTAMSSEVRVLSRFRDRYLLTNPIGESFVNTYYKVSPVIADFVREHPGLKRAVRIALKPAVWMSGKID